MTRRFPSMRDQHPRKPMWPDLVLVAVPAAILLLMLFFWAASANAQGRCRSATMQALAQEHAYDMARRDHLDHDGFMQHRGPAGARAENVAYGYPTEAQTIAQWWRSPGHAANMRLGGCWGIASAVSRSGKRYWAMDISQ